MPRIHLTHSMLLLCTPLLPAVNPPVSSTRDPSLTFTCIPTHPAPPTLRALHKWEIQNLHHLPSRQLLTASGCQQPQQLISTTFMNITRLPLTSQRQSTRHSTESPTPQATHLPLTSSHPHVQPHHHSRPERRPPSHHRPPTCLHRLQPSLHQHSS